MSSRDLSVNVNTITESIRLLKENTVALEHKMSVNGSSSGRLISLDSLRDKSLNA